MSNNDTVIDIDGQKAMKKLTQFVPIVIIIVFALIFLGNSFYILESNENAVILRFGKVAQVVGEAGPHLKMPFADKVLRVSKSIYSMEYGYRTAVSGTETQEATYTKVDEEAKVIVDAAENRSSIALIELMVQYRIIDPEAYLFNVDDVEGTLRLALEDTIRNSVQSLSLDQAKTQKEIIDAAVLKELQRKMDNYGTGIQLTSVGTQNVRFLENVEAAYQQKENANQYKNAKKEDAERYKNTVLPQANAEATQLVEEANAYKAETIANANAAVAEFNALYTEYLNNPGILKEKYYLEAMTEFLTNNNIVVDTTENGDIYKFYNINESDMVKEQITTSPAQ